MKTSALAMLLLTACHRVFDLDEVRRLDASVDAIPDDGCFGQYGQDRAGLVRICLDAMPDKPLDLPANVDTTNCAITAMQSNGVEVCVLAGTTVTVPFSARIHGARPLVVIAVRQLVIGVDGVIDVSGRRSMPTPAGANVASCSAPSQNAMNINSGNGAGGGAGGALSATGGNGGTGSTSGTPRSGGVSLASVAFDGVRGGCRGGRGGSTSYAMGGAGGSSGGALYLIAGESIVVRGVINASGEGGGPG
ncbi:MAG: hypothetical protein H0T89_00190, partial [Deltaproteobacteria bacterium]|nr:hypothetical protein [Deltaproteobacteria bacterium]